MLPSDVHPAVFGERLLDVLRRHGFGVLGKPQLEAAIFYALKEASSQFRNADAFTRAELLPIPDSSYRSLNRRAAMWLSTPDSRAGQEKILAEWKIFSKTMLSIQVRRRYGCCLMMM